MIDISSNCTSDSFNTRNYSLCTLTASGTNNVSSLKPIKRGNSGGGGVFKRVTRINHSSEAHYTKFEIPFRAQPTERSVCAFSNNENFQISHSIIRGPAYTPPPFGAFTTANPLYTMPPSYIAIVTLFVKIQRAMKRLYDQRSQNLKIVSFRYNNLYVLWKIIGYKVWRTVLIPIIPSLSRRIVYSVLIFFLTGLKVSDNFTFYRYYINSTKSNGISWLNCTSLIIPCNIRN